VSKRALDLFCGAGGAAVGLHRAGYSEIVGVDIRPQKRYPFQFVQADALAYPLEGFDLIWASPPCQAHSQLRHLMHAQKPRHDPTRHVDLIPQTRARLVASRIPYIIENVMGAPLWPAVKLCGSYFGLRVRRHRVFESDQILMGTPCRHKDQGQPLAVYGHSRGKKSPQRNRQRRDGHSIMFYACPASVAEAREAMGIDWMTWAELTQAIPPAFSEYLGRQTIAAIERPSTGSL
jgi:DNA (cytosine-5)-methyltransferase 1